MKSEKKSKPRVRSVPTHRSFRLSKKKLSQHRSLPGAYRIFKDTFRLIYKFKLLFIGIALINLVVSYVFVQGLGYSFDLAETKRTVDDVLGSGVSQIGTAFALLGYLAGTSQGSSGQNTSAYQLFILLITSLAVIWTTRQILAGHRPRIRDGFYRGMYPLIPFLLILFVIALQFLPLIIGNLIYATIVQNGLASSSLEKVIWLLVFICLALLSLYMLTSSIFSLYIATLPEMDPVKALRSARELVLHRRLQVSLRIIALPVALTIIGLLILIPLLIFLPIIAQIIFLVMMSVGLVIFHVYMYLLYRALI